jgi:hypothetical protein
MRRVALPLAVFLLAGCGGNLGVQHEQPPVGGSGLSADGISGDLPAGWTGRILLGASGRPVLHAASFPLPSSDDDSGELAKESMGRDIYVNVRDLGQGNSAVAFPVSFSGSDFGPPPPGDGSLCCRITQVSREVAMSGELYRITVISGGQEPPGTTCSSRQTVCSGRSRSRRTRPRRFRRFRPAQGGSMATRSACASRPAGTEL